MDWICQRICMGRADRHFGPVIQGKLIESEIFGFDGIPVIYDDIRRMADFVESREVSFWRMRPSDGLLEKKEEDDMIYCLAEPQKEYLIYFVRGGEIKLELRSVNLNGISREREKAEREEAWAEGRVVLRHPTVRTGFFI